MKSLILFSLILIAFMGNAQSVKFPIDTSTGRITYTEVITLNESISKGELFSRAKACFTSLFKNSKSVIQNEDSEAGSITGKGNFSVFARALGTNYDGGVINFTLTIGVKSGRYKYIITDFSHDAGGTKMPSGGNIENGKPKHWMQKQWDSVLTQMENDMNNLISSIKSEMIKPTPKSDNW